MYIDPRPRRRRRRRATIPILLVAIGILAVVGYYANQRLELIRNPFETPTPSPTPTRTTLSYLAEGQALIEQGEIGEAIEAYRTVAEREPENDEVRRELTTLLIYTSRFDQALIYAQEAEAINPDDARNLADESPHKDQIVR